MMSADTSTSPKVDLFVGTGITVAEDHPIGRPEDLGYPDAISDMVGRAAFLSPWTEDGCVLPGEDDEDGEAATFDRYYFATDGEEPVLVDELPGGSAVEVAEQETARHVAVKRAWCKARGVEYIVHIDPLLAAWS
jgi:hypothetical protein